MYFLRVKAFRNIQKEENIDTFMLKEIYTKFILKKVQLRIYYYLSQFIKIKEINKQKKKKKTDKRQQ